MARQRTDVWVGVFAAGALAVISSNSALLAQIPPGISGAPVGECPQVDIQQEDRLANGLLMRSRSFRDEGDGLRLEGADIRFGGYSICADTIYWDPTRREMKVSGKFIIQEPNRNRITGVTAILNETSPLVRAFADAVANKRSPPN